MKNIISDNAVKTRTYCVEEIRKLSGNFGNDTDKLEKELEAEIKKSGHSILIDHLRLCGSIPESYGHDRSEEKLYSKYTDCLLSLSYKAIGLKSLVIKERADAADVEAFAKKYSFVADAKAFRLSRTAKNQKDFKVQAMEGWKRGKPYAMVVCPIYQLPNTSSQIYQQATTRNVCVFTYSHLALLLAFSEVAGKPKAQELLTKIFKTVAALNPCENGLDYWTAVNTTILDFSENINELWRSEKIASVEAQEIIKEEKLYFEAIKRETKIRAEIG